MLEGPIYRLPPFSYRPVALTQAEIVGQEMEQAGLAPAWRKSTGKGIRVCVLDTGVDLTHPDLRIKEAVDFTGGRNPMDRQKHGTHTTGTINAQHNDGGIRGGAPDAELFHGKVLDDSGVGLDEWIVAGINWATEIGAHVLSMSFGSPQKSPRIIAALERYVASGMWRFPIAAAGNEGINRLNWPAASELTLAVASVGRNGLRSPFSCFGEGIDIAAPGEEVLSTIPQRMYARMSGTSMATPVVSAGVALCLSYHKAKQEAGQAPKTPITNLAELKAHMRAVAQQTPDTATGQFGFGPIHVDAMLGLDDLPAEPVPGPGRTYQEELVRPGLIMRRPSRGTGFLEFEEVK